MRIQEHTDLDVYKRAFDAAMLVFDVTRNFPKEEIYSLTDQIRQSSRSVCEIWRKRGASDAIKAAFIAKTFQMQRLKLPKLRCGFNSPFHADISVLLMVTCYKKTTTKSCG